MSGSKLSELALVNYNNVDDQDFVYVVDGNTSSAGYTSNKMTLEQLRRFIISGATAGVVAQVVIHTLEGSGTSPVLPSGMTYATLYNELINEKKPVYLKYLNDFYEVIHVDSDVIKYTSIDTEEVKTISITNASVVSFSVLAIDEIETNAITGSTTYTDQVAATKQNNLVIDGSTAGLVFGGTTGTLAVNKASVCEVLTDVRDDSDPAAPANNEIVTADNLRGALSVGQAVDVSCKPNRFEFVTTDLSDANFLDTFTAIYDNTSGSGEVYSTFGWNAFQKYANGLKYLWVFDVANLGDATQMTANRSSVVNSLTNYFVIPANSTTRIAFTFTVKNPGPYFTVAQGSQFSVSIANCRVYEVTALTDEAIAYIAQLPDPDAFFRSTDAYSIRDKYLIKQDMVCPFIPTIEMSNSDLTVAAGLSYKMQYKSNTPTTRTITADTIPTNGYGWDTHLQLFVDDKTTVNFQSPLVLEDPLTPNSGHNMTIKWRNGQALVYVDDRDIGYIVTVTAGTENGSLYYGLTNDVGEYITFANTTDGTPIDYNNGDMVLDKTVSIIGNGVQNTVIQNAKFSYDLASSEYAFLYGITLRNSTLASINYSHLIIDNCVIDSCSDNGVSTRTLRVDSLSNTAIINNTFDLNNSWAVALNTDISVTNCLFNNNHASYRIVFAMATGNNINISGCTFSNNVQTSSVHGTLETYSDGTVSVTGCIFTNNTPIGFYVSTSDNHNSKAVVESCVFNDSNIVVNARTSSGVTYTGTLTFSGTNILNSTVSGAGSIILSAGSTLTSPEKTGIIDLSGNTHALSGVDVTIDGMTVTNYSSTTNSVLTINGTSNITNCSFINNTISDTEGTLAITGSSAAVNVPNAVLNISDDSIVVISGNTFADNNNILFSGSNITATMSGTNIIKSKLTTYGLGADLTVSDNSIIDMTGNTNSTVINPGRSIVVGTGVKAVTTSGSTVDVTAGTYSTIKNDGTTTPLDANDLYGYYVDYKTNNDSITYVQLTDPSAEGLARFTTKTALEMKDVKEQYLDTRACLLYSNKIDMPEGKKNKVMFYLNNGDFTKKEDGTPLTADELLGKVTWNGSTRLCNFMKEYPELFIQIYQWGDEFILSQTGAAATTGQMFWRDTTQDTGSSYAWKYSTTTIWTASATPNINDLTYSDSSLNTVRSVTEGNLVVRYYGKQYYSVVFSKTEREGFIRDPWFWTSEDGVTHGKQYTSLYMPVACDTNGNPIAHTTPADIRNKTNVSIGSGYLRSIPGETPLTATTLNNFRLYASRTGTDILNAMGRAYLNRMLVFDTGHFNTQTHIAQGLAYMQSFYYFEVRKTGRTMEYGNRTCQIFADPTGLDADIENYWQGPISAGRDSSSTGAVSFARTPANDYYNSTTGVMTYGWRYTTGGVNYDIWTASAKPAANDPTYSDNTLTTVRTGLPVISYTQTAAANKCVTFSWRGLEDFWGSCWEFEEGIQKRQDATLGYAESGYLFTNAISCYTNTEIFKMTDTVASLPIQVTASTLVKNSSNVYAYANTEVSISKSWNPLSGTGTGATQCWIEFPWPKASGGAGILDPITSFTIATNIQTNKVGDYFYNDAAAGSRVLFVGGNAFGGSTVGAFYVHVLSGLGHSSPIFACRLAASEF